MFLGLSGTRVTTFDLPEPGIAASRLCPGMSHGPQQF